MQATTAVPNPDSQATILTSRLKVLHIISGDLWAGAETQAFTLVTALSSQCDIMVTLMNHGELENRLNKAGITTIVIDEKLHSSVQITRRLVKTIKQFQPNIIHTHRQKENILGSVANLIANKGIKHRAASLRTTHGAPEHKVKGPKKVIALLDNLCGNYLQDAVISVSQDLRDRLKQIFPEQKIHVIQNGVDIDALRLKKPAEDIRKNPNFQFHIGIVGRLEPVKRVDLFIRAAQLAIIQNPIKSLLFHVIGEGKLKAELITLSQQLGIADQIIFHGHRSDSTNAIAAMDVVIMCSDHEGTPMTALETLALGKPLIAHKVGGLREVLNEYPELLTDDHTEEGYSTKLSLLLHQPITTQLPALYTSKKNAEQTLFLYRKLLGISVE